MIISDVCKNQITNMPLPPLPMWIIYVLRCRCDSFYIGIAKCSGKDYFAPLYRRIEKHIIGKGAGFTKLYTPVELMEIQYTNTPEQGVAMGLETYKVIEYRRKYGHRVGGGSYQNSPKFTKSYNY